MTLDPSSNAYQRIKKGRREMCDCREAGVLRYGTAVSEAGENPGVVVGVCRGGGGVVRVGGWGGEARNNSFIKTPRSSNYEEQVSRPIYQTYWETADELKGRHSF